MYVFIFFLKDKEVRLLCNENECIAEFDTKRVEWKFYGRDIKLYLEDLSPVLYSKMSEVYNEERQLPQNWYIVYTDEDEHGEKLPNNEYAFVALDDDIPMITYLNGKYDIEPGAPEEVVKKVVNGMF